jgi:hypothetical protein
MKQCKAIETHKEADRVRATQTKLPSASLPGQEDCCDAIRQVAQPMPREKVSLVTGSTSGIGLGIARALAAAGSGVVLEGQAKAHGIPREQVIREVLLA